MKKKATKKIRQTLQDQVNKYLKDNPAIEKSLKIFNMSVENYQRAINAITQQKIKISTTTTDTNNG